MPFSHFYNLTAEYRDMLTAYAERWIGIGTATGPCDREFIEKEAVPTFYRDYFDLSAPKSITWVDSPTALADAAKHQDANDCLATKFEDSFILGRVKFEDSFTLARSGIIHSTSDETVYRTLEGVMHTAIWSRLGSLVREQAVYEVAPSKYGIFGKCIQWGQHDADLVGFHEFVINNLSISTEFRIDGWKGMTGAGWYVPYEDAIIISERPIMVERNAQGNMHNETGYAIQYPDGWGFCCWNGVSVPEEWILNKDEVNPRLALTSSNMEQRRCLCEILGWERVLESCDAREVQRDDFGTLLEIKGLVLDQETDSLAPGRVLKFVRVTCPSTHRQYILATFPDVQTAHEAVARSFGSTVEEYDPRIET